MGVTTTVASLDSPDSVWLQNDTYKTIALGPVFGPYGYCRNLPSKILSIARNHDVVIVHGMWQYHAFATWRALHGTSIPYLVYPHGMLDPWFKKSFPFKHLKKWLYWPWADYRLLRDAQSVLFTTDLERILARQSFFLYKANEIVVGYGTSQPPEELLKHRTLFLNTFPHLRGKRILLFISRIHPKKGVDILLEAFASVASCDSDLHLVIAGPDQVGLQAKLQQRAVDLGIVDRVTWPGMLTGDLKWGAFQSAELFCLPSHQENFGIVVAEAIACGLPVAIAEPINISSVVAAAGAGIVHPDSAAGTTLALRQWLAMSPSSRTQMGFNGSRLFLKEFDFASVARNLIPVLESAVQSRKS